MAKVKICGVTNLEDALICVKFGADAIGFNFYEKSKRFIKTSEARSIIEQINSQIPKFGVFVNASIEEILDTVNTSRIDVIQLHGVEAHGFVSELRHETRTPIIKAFRVSEDFDASYISDFKLDAILLDAYTEGEFGGTGNSFDWDKAVSAIRLGVPTYLAGGLDPENVAEAVRFVRPFAVDVASGVESAPGRKDPVKVEAFIRSAKQA